MEQQREEPGRAPTARSPLLIREYDRTSDFERHAAELADEGWFPLTVQRFPPRRGVLGALSSTLAAFGLPCDSALLVMYAAD